MKKMLLLLISVLVCFALVACDSCNPADNGQGNGPSDGNAGNFPFDEDGGINLPVIPLD